MHEERLRQLNGDVQTKEALIDFIHAHIDATALKLMYEKKDVSHIADAVKLIDEAIEQLDIIYGLKTKQQEAVNQAR